MNAPTILDRLVRDGKLSATTRAYLKERYVPKAVNRTFVRRTKQHPWMQPRKAKR